MKKIIMALMLAFSAFFLWNSKITAQAYPRNMHDGYFFDAEYYASAYPDVAACAGGNENILYQHYKIYGYREGRFAYAPGSAFTVFAKDFDAAYYAVNNPDVVRCCGNSPLILYTHYVNFGKAQGRTGRPPYDTMPSVTRADFPQAAAVLDTIGWDLRSAYNWSAGTLTYYGHGKPDMPEEGSSGIKWFADFGFTNHKGNCFVYASTFYEMAKLLGYNVRQVEGKVPLARGGYGPHSWDEIDIGGVTYVFDPECTYATKKDIFMILYGTPGTWRYTPVKYMSE